MKSVVLLRGTTGLNNIADPVRIGYDEQSGVGDLAEAYNIDIDDSGRPSRREGFTATTRTESVHSLYAEKEYCLYMSGSSLYRLYPDYSRVGLRSSMTTGAALDYAYVNSLVYYTNGFEKGYVNGDTSYTWVKGSYVGVTTFKQLSNPPIGHLVCYYNGRMYVAQENVLWYSEPFAFGAFDLTRNYFMFPSKIQMVKAVADGLFVSDSTNVYSLVFTNPVACVQTTVHDYPVILGSAVVSDAMLLQLPNLTGPVVICATKSGICVGASAGSFKSLTIDRVTYPAANRAAAVVKDNTYICLLQE